MRRSFFGYFSACAKIRLGLSQIRRDVGNGGEGFCLDGTNALGAWFVNTSFINELSLDLDR